MHEYTECGSERDGFIEMVRDFISSLKTFPKMSLGGNGEKVLHIIYIYIYIYCYDQSLVIKT